MYQRIRQANKSSDIAKWFTLAYEEGWPETETLASALTGSHGG